MVRVYWWKFFLKLVKQIEYWKVRRSISNRRNKKLYGFNIIKNE